MGKTEGVEEDKIEKNIIIIEAGNDEDERVHS